MKNRIKQLALFAFLSVSLAGVAAVFLTSRLAPASDDPEDLSSPLQKHAQMADGPQEEELTYSNHSYGFSFRYPSDFNIRDFTERPVVGFNREKVNLHINAQTIDSVEQADGPCGTASSRAYQEQRSLFDQSDSGARFDTGFRITNYGAVQSSVLVNPQGVKVAYGIDICVGLAGRDDLGSLDFVAVSFKDGIRISLRAPLTREQSGNVRVKDLERKAERVAAGTAGGQTQAIFDRFLGILNSLEYSQIGP